MAGCWTRESATRIVDEQWMSPRADMIFGMARTISKKDGRVAEYEQMHIQERDGKLIFTSKPSGQPEASFDAVTVTDSMVVFENPTHDFPQRVGYRRVGPDSIEAWIEGRPDARQDAPLRRVPFPYTRTRCP